MATVSGHCDPRFTSVRTLLSTQLSSEAELGASITVTHHNKTLLDIHGGYTTAARTTSWSENTIVPVWSITKTISALAVLLLIDRGQLHPDDPLAKYWPAFDTDDKRSIRVRHCLSHTAGLPSWSPPITTKELFTDYPSAREKLAAQKPWWEPGTASGYHLVAQGVLLGELVHRVSGKSIGEFIRDELALPLDADFHLGLADDSQYHRIAEVIPPPPFPKLDLKDIDPASPQALALRAIRGLPLIAEESGTPGFRKSGVGSMAGFSNSRGFNKILSIITNRGTVNGTQFLKPETVDLIFEVQAEGPDLVVGLPLKMGLGFGLVNGALDWLPRTGKVCYWGGWGGSLAVMDLDRGVTITYAMNRMEAGTLGNSNSELYFREVYRAFGRGCSRQRGGIGLRGG
ncbi:beta-lactamase/transpeptidase-like protein [Aspergillus crustosus]